MLLPFTVTFCDAAGAAGADGIADRSACFLAVLLPPGWRQKGCW